MDKLISKHRKKLNTEQIEVLGLLYKFRFGSNDLIARHFGKKDRSFVFKRLKILQEQGLIGKRFDSSYRIQGKPVAYYLLPAGARALQEHRTDTVVNIKAIYKDKTVSEEFIEYCLSIFGIYTQLKTRYGDSLCFFTKNQLTKYDYFSDFTPSVYIRLNTNGPEKDYFLEYLQSSKPFLTSMRRIKQYIDYSDGGEWEAGTNSEFPEVLLVCDKLALQNRLLKKSATVRAGADDDLKIYVTVKDDKAIWFDLAEPDSELSASPIS